MCSEFGTHLALSQIVSGQLSPQRSHPIRRLKGYRPLTFPTKVWSDIIPVATTFFYALT
jgi:hypothetical protein